MKISHCSVLVAFALLSPVCAVAQGTQIVCAKHLTVPEYPPIARHARIEGTVKLAIEVKQDGRVLSVKASGANDVLNRAAEKTVQEWSFYPSCGGEMESNLTISFVYKLTGREGDAAPIVVFELPNRVEITATPGKVYPSSTGR